MEDKEERKFTYDYLNTDNKLIMSEEEMADKEERIFVFTTIKYTIKETNEDGVIVDGFIEPRDKAKMYTRKEAIEVMAKAIFSKSGFPKDCIWEKINEETKTAFRLYAREALNALLEGVKNEKPL